MVTKFLKHIEAYWFATLAFLLPLPASAACSNTAGSSFQNPLNFCSLKDFVAGALQVFVMIMLPVIAFFIVLAGFNFVWARGNPTGLQKAKMNFLFVIIGTCLMLGAWLLANLIGATVSQVTG